MAHYVGTVSWTFKDWRETFYPRGLRPADQLAFYARRFGVVEVDATFHAGPRRETVDGWASAVPAGFRFCLKAPKAITHERLLEGCAEDLAAFLALADGLGARRGPVILQLPPRFGRSRLPTLFGLLETLPHSPGLSIEFRHDSCFTAETFGALRDRGVGLVTTEKQGGYLLSGPDVVLRLMGDRDAVSVFDRVVIDRERDVAAWAERTEQLPEWVRDAYLLVGNHFSGHSPATATDLGVRLGVIDPPEPPLRQDTLFGDAG